MAYQGETARSYAVRRRRTGTDFVPLAAWDPLSVDIDDVQFTLWWLGLLPAAAVTGRGNAETVLALSRFAERKNLRPGSAFVRVSGGVPNFEMAIDSRLSPLLAKEMQSVERLPEAEKEALRSKLVAARLREGAPSVTPPPVAPRAGAPIESERWYERRVLGMPAPLAIGASVLLLGGLAALAFRRRVVPNGAVKWHRISDEGELEALVAGETVGGVVPTKPSRWGKSIYCAAVKYGGELCFAELGKAKDWVEREVRRLQKEHARFGGAED